MHLAFSSSLAVYGALLAASAALLPERVPLHFTLGGEPDRWGTRTELLVVLAGAGLLLAACFGLSARAVATADLSSPWWNLPHREWWTATPDREALARTRLRADLLAVGTAATVLLGVVLVSVVVAARRDQASLAPVTMAAVAALVLGLLVWALWTSLHRYRPLED